MRWMDGLANFGPLQPDFYYGRIAAEVSQSFWAGIRAHSAKIYCKTASGCGRCQSIDPGRDAERYSTECA